MNSPLGVEGQRARVDVEVSEEGIPEPEIPSGVRTGWIPPVNGTRTVRNRLSYRTGLINGLKRRRPPLRGTGKRRGVVALAIIVLLLAGAMVSLISFPPENEPITIDGAFADWSDKPRVQDKRWDSSSMDIVNYSVVSGYDYIFVYVEFASRVFEGRKVDANDSLADSVRVFLDADHNMKTGYRIFSFGMDYMVHLAWVDDTLRVSSMAAYAGGGLDFQWRVTGGVRAAHISDRVEISIPKNETLNDPWILIHALGWKGDEDLTDVVVDANSRGVIAEIGVTLPSIITSTNISVMDITFLPAGNGFTLGEMEFRILGNSENVKGISGWLRGRAYPGVISGGTVKVVVNTGIHPGDTLTVKGSLVNLYASEVFGLKPVAIRCDAPVTYRITGDYWAGYMDSVPRDIRVDGATGEWSGVTPDAGSPVKPNNDIISHALLRDGGRTSFLVKVRGEMLGGTPVPVGVTGISSSPSQVNQSKPSVPLGEDRWTIYLGTSNDTSGEWNERFNLYLKWKVEITGKNGDPISTSILAFREGAWVKEGTPDVNVFIHGMEVGTPIADGFMVVIESSDYEGKNIDYISAQSDYRSPEPPSTLATTVSLPVVYDVTATSTGACAGAAPYWREDFPLIDIGTNKTPNPDKCGRGVLKFNLSSIPPMATVSSAVLQIYVVKLSSSAAHRTSIFQIINDPETSTDDLLFTDAGDGNVYVKNSKFLSSLGTTGWQKISLGGSVAADLTSSLSKGWFALGFASNNQAIGQIASMEYSGGGYKAFLTITYSLSAITVSPASTAPEHVYQGDTGVVMGSFTLSLNSGVKTITGINITRYTTSTGSDGDISSVRLYNDTNQDGLLGSGDVLLGETTFISGVANFPLSLVLSSATPIRVLLVFNISVSATPFNKDGGKINASSDIRVQGTYITGTPVEMGCSLILEKVMMVNPGGTGAPSVVYLGDTDVVMGQFQFIMNSGTDTITSLTLTRYSLSTGSDLDFNEIRLFYDSNNDGSISGEAQIGTPQTLASGRVSFSGITIPVDNLTGVRVLVVANISITATAGNTDGFRIQADTDITSTYRKSGTFPVSLGASLIDRRVVMVSMGGFTAPDVIPRGSTDVVMGQFTLRTNNATDTITRISITRYGLSADSDVTSVRLFLDSNNDGIPAGDTQLGAETVFTSGVATFDSLTLVAGTQPVYILVVVNISPSAIIDDTLGCELTAGSITPTSFPVSGTFPIQMGLTRIVSTALIVARGGFTAPPDIYQGMNDIVMGQFTMQMSSNIDNVLEINITMKGTASDSDVTGVRLFYDSNNDGSFSGETQISGERTFTSGVARFAPLLIPVTTTPVRVLVVINLSASATVGSTLAMSINASSDIHTSTYPVSAVLPVILGYSTIRGTLFIAGGINAPSTVYQGATDIVMGQLSFSTNQGSTVITSINITRYTTGSGSDSDISSIRLFTDVNGDGSLAGESMIGTPCTFSGGVASFTGLSIPVTPVPGYILIVFNFTQNAPPGNNDGAQILSALDVVSNFIESGAFPVSLGTSTILTNYLQVSVGDFTAPPEMFPAQSNLVMGQFRLNTLAGSDTVTGISLTRYTSGSGGDPDIASVRLFLDSNNDGQISGETQIGAETVFTGGVAAFTGLSLPVTSAGVRILVVFNISSSAPIGNSDGARITLAGDIQSTLFQVTGSFPVSLGTSTVTAPRLLVSDPDGANPPPPVYTTAGDTGVIMGRLRLVMNFGTDTVTSLRVTRTGTGADADFALVRLIYDVNGNGQVDLTDTQLGVDSVFAGGSVTFTFSLGVSTTPEYILIVSDFLDTIVDGTTEGTSIAQATDIVVTSTGVSGSFPVLFGNTIIKSTTLSVSAGDFSAPSSTYQGSRDVVMGQFTLSTNQGSVTVTGINITRYTTGSGSDSDITHVRLYTDSNNDGSISGETQIGTPQTLSGGTARFTSLSLSVGVFPVRVLVVFNFSAYATPGNRSGARISAYTDVTASPPTAVTGAFPVDLGETTILQTVMSVFPGSYTAPETVYPSQSSVVMGQFVLTMNANTDTVTQIRVSRYGTSSDTDISSVRLFYDSNNDGSISGEVQINGEKTFSSGVATFTTSIPVGTSLTRILAVCNISSSATPGKTIGLQITAPGDIVSTYPKSGIFPVTLGVSTVTGLSVSGVDHAPPSASPGSTNILMLELQFTATGTPVSIDTITVTHTGSGQETDVTAVRLYLDDGDGIYSASDTLLGSGIFSSGRIMFGSPGVPMITVSPGVTTRVFIVCDFSPSASGTHGVRIADRSSITTINAGSPSGLFPITSTETSFIPEMGYPGSVFLMALAVILLITGCGRISPSSHHETAYHRKKK